MPVQSFYDSRAVEAESLSIVMENGTIEDIAESSSQGLLCRSLVGGSWGYSMAGGAPSVDCAARAEQNARALQSITHKSPIELATPSAPPESFRARCKLDPRDVGVEEKVEMMRQLHERTRLDEIVSTRIAYAEEVVRTSYTNSEGIEVSSEYPRVRLSVLCVARRGELLQMGLESIAHVGGYELVEMFNAHTLAHEAALRAVRLLDAVHVKAGPRRVILDPELAGVFTHEAVGHATEADIVLEGGSILAHTLGRRIAAEGFSVVDDPTLRQGYGFYAFDDEGTRAKPTQLIDDGVHVGYLHSRETAARLDGGEGGNARAQGTSVPIVRMSNTFVQNGEMHLDEMLSELGEGVYLKGSRGGQVSTAEGVFQFNAEYGYEVKDGEVGHMLRDVSLSGKTLDILQRVEGVGCDLELHSGRCGKSGQLVPVSDGSPHLLVGEALVGGR
ncbi:MAG: TldD/PmbA family protein [Methermicoccaceae archaeon]